MSYYADLSDTFAQIAADIQTQLEKQGAALSQTEYNSLASQHDQLIDDASDLIDADLQQTLDTLAIDKLKLKNCVTELETAIRHIQKVDSLISIATTAFTLSTAVLAADPGAIVSGIEGAKSAIMTWDQAVPSDGLSMAASGDDDV